MKIFEKIKEKGMLMVAHRGSCGGNIPCNSLEAFQIALNHGADVIELDVEKSKDGVLFIQHPGMEHVHLGLKDSLINYTSEEISKMHLLNEDLTPTQYTIPTLETALLFLKDRCIINIDKFWENPKEIAALVENLGMQDQVLIKTDPKEEYLDAIEKYAPTLPYMAIVRKEDCISEKMATRNINYVGTEVLFTSEDDEVCSDAYISKMHANKKIVWVNAIVYNYLEDLSAGHNDDVSLIKDPKLGWGWCRDKGFDLIQTDFVLACRLYLENNRK